ncbi:hypothetical protein [Streptomyces boninensis]|uniref:hypothetical protein n=1 Tax=Streptomyces boninensis TaxID=2039455 RepID=UPI003B20BA00
MELTLSVWLVAGIGVAVMLKLRSTTATAAVLAALFGFYLADTSAAPDINELVQSVAQAVKGFGD